MDVGTQKNHLRLIWDGKTYRGEGSILGKKIRKSLKIRSKSKRKLAQDVLDAMFNEEYMKGLARQKAQQSKLFSDAAFEYMEAKGYNRYADYVEKILQILGPHAR